MREPQLPLSGDYSNYRVNECNGDLSSTMGHARWEALYNFPVLILNQASSPLFILFAEAS